MTNELTPVVEWLGQMQACVRAIDYARAEQIFAAGVVGFGTYEGIASGREKLRAAQWSNIWPRIRDFTFRLETLHGSMDGDLAWGACTWDSTGFRADGTPFARPGRMTVILERREGKWLATHTHFSQFPIR